VTSDLFSDLKSLSLSTVETNYRGLLENLTAHEASRKELFLQKKLHSEVIQFAVNKLTEAPPTSSVEPFELLTVTIEQKKEFDRLLHHRDAMFMRLAVPRHRLQYLMNEFYQRLTHPSHHTEAPTLASEMELFARFFEMQAMLEIHLEHHELLHEIHVLRGALLENVKSINREDRKLVQMLAKGSEKAQSIRREAGRLRAYLQLVEGTNPEPIPEPSEELTLRLVSGGALTMEEFAAMLEYGGLTEFEVQAEPQTEKKPRQKHAQRRANPLRGDAGRTRNRRM
jgi:hypothetical protein